MTQRPAVLIDRDMIGGNGELLSFDDATSTLVARPEKKDGSPHRGWFLFRIRNLEPGRTYTLKLIENTYGGVYVFRDASDGTWRHFADFHQDSQTDFSFTFTPASAELEVAMMPPYFQAQLDQLIEETAGHELLSITNLWTTEEGRDGKLFTIGNPAAEGSVWITARMHAFEAVSSWAAEGLIRWALSSDPDAQWLVKNRVLYVVPMVDVDAVQHGGTGKHRAPICFARDVRPNPHWNAIKALVREWKLRGAPDVFLDIHGPGGEVSDVYFYAPEPVFTTPAYERELVSFCSLLADTLPAGMRYEKRVYRCPCVLDGQGQSMAGTGYFYLHHHYFGKSRLRLSLGVETPWSPPGYTIELFAQCGAGYGKAISRLLRGA